METKSFEFEDGSKISFEFLEDEHLAIVLQAKHLGQEFKITAARAVLDPTNVTELVNWIGDVLLAREESNG